MDRDSVKDHLLHFPVSQQKTHQFCEFMGYAMPAQEIVFGRNNLRRVKPVLDDAIAQRLELIADQTQDICRASGFGNADIKPLDHGKDGVVFEVDNDTVLRMQWGESKQRFNDPQFFLQPHAYQYDPALNVTFEILPKVTMDVTPDEITEISNAVKEKHGIVVWDMILSNFGRTKQGNVVIIDPDSYQMPKNFKP